MKDPTKVRKRPHTGESKVVDRRSLSRIKREIVKNPTLRNGNFFKGIGDTSVPRTTRCRILKRMAKPLMSIVKPSLSKTQKQTRVKWAEDNVKVNFSKVLFAAETRTTLDGLDGWSKGWASIGGDRHHHLRRRQGGGGKHNALGR